VESALNQVYIRMSHAVAVPLLMKGSTPWVVIHVREGDMALPNSLRPGDKIGAKRKTACDCSARSQVVLHWCCSMGISAPTGLGSVWRCPVLNACTGSWAGGTPAACRAPPGL
jgi:hypothetical protein